MTVATDHQVICSRPAEEHRPAKEWLAGNEAAAKASMIEKTAISSSEGPSQAPHGDICEDRCSSEELQARRRRPPLNGDPELECPLSILNNLLCVDAACINMTNGPRGTVRTVYSSGQFRAETGTAGQDQGSQDLNQAMLAWENLPGISATGLVVIEDVASGTGWSQGRSNSARSRLTLPAELQAKLGLFRFCLAFPLVNADGDQLGTLFMYKTNPHILDVLQEAIMFDMVSLVGTYLQRSLTMWQSSNAAARKSLDRNGEAALLLDTESTPWAIVHMNAAASQITGMQWEGNPMLMSAVFDAETLKVLEERQPAALLQEHHMLALAIDRTCQLTFALQPRPAAGEGVSMAQHEYVAKLQRVEQSGPCHSDDGTSGSGGSARDSWGLAELTKPGAEEFSSACNDWSNNIGIGTEEASTSFTFSQLGSLGWGYVRPNATISVPFKDLQLGHQLGKGASGRVYSGTYGGERVAVKVIDHISTKHLQGGVPLEALLPSRLEHPNVVKTLAQTLTSEEGGEVGPDDTQVSAWYIMEFCDSGDLGAAVTGGRFRSDDPGQYGGTHMPMVLDIALDIAHAMAYMHTKGIIHGDLSGGNVLLAKKSGASRGYHARIGDFGLSRQLLDVRSRVSTNSYGTVNYLAPEVVSDGSLSKAGDVYAFGVLCWELIHNSRAWARMLHAQIMYAVLINGQKLEFSEFAHPAIAALSARCMSFDRIERPSFAECVHILNEIKDSL